MFGSIKLSRASRYASLVVITGRRPRAFATARKVRSRSMLRAEKSAMTSPCARATTSSTAWCTSGSVTEGLSGTRAPHLVLRHPNRSYQPSVNMVIDIFINTVLNCVRAST